MGLRKGAAYSKRKVVPYTRKSKKKKKSYIKTIPPVSIVKFSMGKEELFKKGKFPYHLTMIATENVQIRDSALEACRQFINRKLEDNFSGQFFFRVLVHPHHIQRENKMLTGAGSDRMQTGMQLAFGKAADRAAITKHGKPIFFIAVQNKKAEQFVRRILHQINSKLPCKTRIVSEEIKK